MTRWSRSHEDTSAERIRRLEDELYEARNTIVSLTQEPLRSHLKSYYRCDDEASAHDWLAKSVEMVIEIANASATSGWGGAKRASCPLCGSSGHSYNEIGYALPEGLRRHLEGHGTARECRVMGAAWKLARSYWNPIFNKRAAEADAAAAAVRAERRKTETMYQFSPIEPPLLYDEKPPMLDGLRPLDKLPEAERRLKALGFSIKVVGNVKSYVREVPGATVHADPRPEKKMKFVVVLSDGVPKGRARKPLRYEQFSLLDTWKNDLRAKLDKLIEGAVAALSKKRNRV